MPRRQKLELTWIGKENRPRLEPRILLEDPEHSHHAEHRVSEDDHFDNVLIQGDNLLALKALETQYTGKVKCIYIDPPFNTGQAFEQYDDGVEHSVWLSLMRDRLEMLWRLLSVDGSIWVHCDDNEVHYLKVMMDEVFGRDCFVANVVWQKRTSPEQRVLLGAAHDYILVYSREPQSFKFNKLPLTVDQATSYTNTDDDPRGPWASTDFTAQGYRPNQMYTITTPSGKSYEPPDGRCWGATEPEFLRLRNDERIWFGKTGGSRPRVKKFLSEHEGISAWTWWANSEVGHNQEAKKESIAIYGSAKQAFSTPKPERLLERIITIATDPGDLILDSFAGSGTTGAVAHKMGRRWIMVELGDHAFTHIVPRLKKVVDGEDEGGITESAEWKGGGGFRTYRLAPSLMKKDTWGQWVVNPDYNAEMLAEALCKHEGFTYAPSDEHFWMHGHSTESDFVYVTTQTLTADQLRFIADEVGPDRTLLVLCAAWRGDETDFPNLTLKKIPNAVLDRCEWGRDDYSLNVAELPLAPAEPDREPAAEPDALPLFNQTAETTA